MVPGGADELNRISCGIVLIGQNPLLRKRIAFVLRVAGFRIADSVPDADLAFLGAVPREHQIVSICEVNTSFEETSRHLTDFTTLYPMGGAVFAASGVSAAKGLMLVGAAWPVLLILACGTHTNLPRACECFHDGEAVKGRFLKTEKGRRSAGAGKGADGISERAASWGAVTPAATAGGRSVTARQAMILKSLMNGDSNKAVACKLRIAEGTVKVHIKRLLRRIGVNNRTQAAIWALENNFTRAPTGETGELRSAARPKTEFGVPPGPQLRRREGGKGRDHRSESVKSPNITKTMSRLCSTPT